MKLSCHIIIIFTCRTVKAISSYVTLIQVRILINSTLTDRHAQAPYVGITGCWFYDNDPSVIGARRFDLIDENGCVDPPSSYNPFRAAGATSTGMYLNEKPNSRGKTHIDLRSAF